MSDKHVNPALRAANAAFIAELLPRILEPIREVAHGHGYAIAIHGSLARDIDLVAIPWVEWANDADELVRSIRGAVAGVLGRCLVQGDARGAIKAGEKPHGRRAYTLIHAGRIGEIDLSVMPKLAAAAVSPDEPDSEEPKP